MKLRLVGTVGSIKVSVDDEKRSTIIDGDTSSLSRNETKELIRLLSQALWGKEPNS